MIIFGCLSIGMPNYKTMKRCTVNINQYTTKMSSLNSITIYPMYKFSALTINNAVPLKRTRKKIAYSHEFRGSQEKNNLSFIEIKSSKISELLDRKRKFSMQNYREIKIKDRLLQSPARKLKPLHSNSPINKPMQNQNFLEKHKQSMNSLRQCLTKKSIGGKYSKGMKKILQAKSMEKQFDQVKQSISKQKIKRHRKRKTEYKKYEDIPIEEFLATESEAEIELPKIRNIEEYDHQDIPITISTCLQHNSPKREVVEQLFRDKTSKENSLKQKFFSKKLKTEGMEGKKFHHADDRWDFRNGPDNEIEDIYRFEVSDKMH